jgi:cytochrome c biogenesis protein CcmG/thiol:disulfide interchange protein DsbE
MPADPPTRATRLSQTLRGLGVLAAVGFVALLGYGIVAQRPSSTIDDSLIRARAVDAPAFDLEVLHRGRMPEPLRAPADRAAKDGRVGLRELRGTPVVLNFWASWCPPCREEAPLLEREWRRVGRQGVLFLGLDIQDVRDDARAFIREFGISYLNVREADKTTARRYGVTGLPETFFITRRGEIVGHVIGAITPEQLRAGIEAARSGRPVAPKQGGARQNTR